MILDISARKQSNSYILKYLFLLFFSRVFISFSLSSILFLFSPFKNSPPNITYLQRMKPKKNQWKLFDLLALFKKPLFPLSLSSSSSSFASSSWNAVCILLLFYGWNNCETFLKHWRRNEISLFLVLTFICVITICYCCCYKTTTSTNNSPSFFWSNENTSAPKKNQNNKIEKKNCYKSSFSRNMVARKSKKK